MTKAELVEEVSKAAELTKKDSEVIVDEVFKNIIQALNRGDKIELRGFGSFRVRKRDARRGRNPKTGEPVDIPAKSVPYFKPGKELKELINGKQPGEGADDDFDDDDDDFETGAEATATENINNAG
ncbi:MAG TPA: integration host factor subunit beta [Blastocatellia bacterium]|nr:integration host factor subunit beta [Blastocatellia bacterium]